MPFHGTPGSVQVLTALPGNVHEVVQKLSKLAWQTSDIGDGGPTLDANGRIEVQKVYYCVGVPNKRPLTSFLAGDAEVSFPEFLDFCQELAAGTTVGLLLWHELKTPPPSPPGKDGGGRVGTNSHNSPRFENGAVPVLS
jgi:hypothetical protein